MNRWGAVGAGCLVTLALVWTGRVPEAGIGWRLAHVTLHLGAFTGLVGWLRTSAPSPRLVIGGAVLFRLLALPMLPTLSDDGYRYLWDGQVSVEQDESPYRYRPSDSALSDRQSGTEYQRMNSNPYYSVYPPASQLGFALAVRLGGHDWRHAWWIWKVLLVLCELGAIWALLRIVPPASAAVYAWSPLAVIEVAGQGHTEALVVAGLAAALVAGATRWPLASVGLTLAGGAKVYPLVWLPQAWRRDGIKGVVASLGLAIPATVLFWHPSAFSHVTESLGLFFGQFDEYAAPYLVVKSAVYPLVGSASGHVASRLLGVVFACLVGVRFLTDDGTQHSWRRIIAFGVLAFLLTASTLHPWYWLPVLFVFEWLPARGAVVWLVAWSSAGYLGYVVPGASLGATVIGWGGSAIIFAASLTQKRRQ